jgi:hypothetical protein
MPQCVCHHCKLEHEVPDALIGTSVRCGRCREVFVAEVIPELIDVQSQQAAENAKKGCVGCFVIFVIVGLIGKLIELFQ